MKPKKEKFLTCLILLFMGAILTFTSCEQDYYDPSRQEGTGSSLFGDSISIPANFGWETMESNVLHVKVDDRFNGNFFYQVEILDKNPFFFPDAKVIAKGVAKQGKDWTVYLNLSTELSGIYVKQISPVGQSVVKAVTLTNKNLVVDFNPIPTTTTKATQVSQAVSSMSTRAGSAAQMRTRAGDPSTTYTTPVVNGTTVVALTAETESQRAESSSTSYVIPAGVEFTGNFYNDWWQSSTLYVEGTWKVSGNVNLNYLKVIVQNGGKIINDTPSTFNVNVSSQLIVAAGGEFGKTGSLMTVTQDSDEGRILNSGYLKTSGFTNLRYLFNDGDIYLEGKMNTSRSSIIINKGYFEINNGPTRADALVMQGNFQNEGTVKVKGIFESDSEDFVLTNNGFFEVHSLGSSAPDGSSQGTYYNNGYFAVTNEAYIELNFFIGNGGLLEVADLTMLRSKISIAVGAMLNVTESLNIASSGEYKIIEGANDGISLAKINSVTAPSNTNFELAGNLEVECSNYNVLPDIGTTVDENTTGVNVRFVNVGETTVTIPPSEYNKGGNIVTPPETPPADPRFPIIWNGTNVTYLFEDNWPLLGYYDMNDVVMDVTPTYMTNSENKVTQLRLDVVLRALGATKRLAVGLQLDGIYPSMITNVTRSSKVGVNETVFPTDKTKGLENGQTFAVIPIFDIAFEALGKSSPEITNTIKGGGNSGSSMSVPIIVIFNTPVDIESLSIDKFNLFLVNGGYTSSRDEIHLSGYQPTDKANTSKFGAADDNSNSGRLYTSKNNMIWALAIPGSSSYPTEWTSIRLAFPQFQDWVLSGGGSNKTWYNNPDPDLVY